MRCSIACCVNSYWRTRFRPDRSRPSLNRHLASRHYRKHPKLSLPDLQHYRLRLARWQFGRKGSGSFKSKRRKRWTRWRSSACANRSRKRKPKSANMVGTHERSLAKKNLAGEAGLLVGGRGEGLRCRGKVQSQTTHRRGKRQASRDRALAETSGT